MKRASRFCQIGALCLTILLAANASPVYPIYADYTPPLVLHGAYAPGPYSLAGGGAYFGASGQQHSARGRYSTGHESGGYSEKTIDYQKDSKYYYGGQYKGSCLEDGLYYKDDTTFVMCSNGYPHKQPCPPGTKTSGSPAYKPGYYYGYTDLCSVNLVDYGLGPEHYAPAGPPEYEKSDSRAVSTSKKVSYTNVGYNNGPHHGENHASKDVFRQQDTVRQYGQSDHQQQHVHVEKHKVQVGNGGYDQKVVKQGVVSLYNTEHAGHAHHHAPSHYDAAAQAPYDGAAPASTNQESFHKEKQQTVDYNGNHHHATRQLHQHSVTSHAGGQHHHAAGYNVDRQLKGGLNYPSSERFDPYHGSSASNHDPVVDKVQTSSTVYHATSDLPGHHEAGGYGHQGSGYNQFGEYGYPQLGQGHQAGRSYEY